MDSMSFMSLFRAPKTEEEVLEFLAPALPPAPLAVANMDLISLESVSEERKTLTEHLHKLWKQNMETLPSVEIWATVRAARIAEFSLIVETVGKIDFERLAKADVKQLRTTVYDKVSAATLDSVNEARNWVKPGSYNSIAKARFGEAYTELEQIVRKQYNPEYNRRAPAVTEDYDEPQTLDEAALRALVFPQHDFHNAQIKKALQALEKAWDIARKRPTTVEDRFLLEQIVTSYLPDSWRMIRGFETFTPELQARVEQNVLEQIQLLAEQVQELLNKREDEFLGQIEAHTAFLRARKEHQQPGKLQLERSHGDQVLVATPQRKQQPAEAD